MYSKTLKDAYIQLEQHINIYIFAKKMYSLETLRDAYIRLEPHAELSRGLWPLGLSHAWTEYQGVSASAHFIFLDIFQV